MEFMCSRYAALVTVASSVQKLLVFLLTEKTKESLSLRSNVFLKHETKIAFIFKFLFFKIFDMNYQYLKLKIVELDT